MIFVGFTAKISKKHSKTVKINASESTYHSL